MMDGEKTNQVKMKEVKLPEFSFYCERVRRNLLISSFIICSYVFFGLSIDNGSFMGLVSGFNETNALWLFLVIDFYFLLHFIWLTHDHRLWIKQRLSQDDLIKKTGSSWDGDYKGELAFFNQLFDMGADSLEQKLRGIDSAKAEPLQQQLKFFEENLQRYIKGYSYFSKSQRARFYVFEFGIPVALGLLSLALILHKLFCV